MYIGLLLELLGQILDHKIELMAAQLILKDALSDRDEQILHGELVRIARDGDAWIPTQDRPAHLLDQIVFRSQS
jgi:hypothetical protein